jgi:aminoglycoside phosphotransferase
MEMTSKASGASHHRESGLLPVAPPGAEWLPAAQGESGDRIYRRSDGAAYAKVASRDRTMSLAARFYLRLDTRTWE